jgi:hypothetical protein
MADALRLLIGGPVTAYVALFAVICVTAQIFVQDAHYVRVLKWLCLSLFSYVAALAAVRVPWERRAARQANRFPQGIWAGLPDQAWPRTPLRLAVSRGIRKALLGGEDTE